MNKNYCYIRFAINNRKKQRTTMLRIRVHIEQDKYCSCEDACIRSNVVSCEKKIILNCTRDAGTWSLCQILESK
jgi:hypothetical protein